MSEMTSYTFLNAVDRRLSSRRPKPFTESASESPRRQGNALGLPLFLQPKLVISRPGDPYEQEADRVADQIMRMPGPTVQRQCAPCVAGGPLCPACEKEGAPMVSRKAEGTGISAGDVPSSVDSALS